MAYNSHKISSTVGHIYSLVMSSTYPDCQRSRGLCKGLLGSYCPIQGHNALPNQQVRCRHCPETVMANICLFCNIHLYTLIYILYVYILLYIVGGVLYNCCWTSTSCSNILHQIAVKMPGQQHLEQLNVSFSSSAVCFFVFQPMLTQGYPAPTGTVTCHTIHSFRK